MKNTNFEKQYTIEDLECLLDTLPSEVCLKDKYGKIIYANKSFCEQIGRDKSEVIGKTDYDLRERRDADICSLSDEHVLTTNKMNVSIEFLHQNDNLLKYKISKVPINSKNQRLIGGHLEKVNITDLLSSTTDNNIKLHYKNIRLIEMFIGIKNKFINILSNKHGSRTDTTAINNGDSEFFANVLHEFKTPINIISATTQLILSNINDNNNLDMNNLARYMKSIKQNSLRLLRLVNNVLDSSKISGGYYTLNLKNYNIVSVIEDIVTSTADYVKGKNRSIIFDTDVEELIVACDPDKIERVVLNLLSNSLKYTSDGGKIEVNVKVDSIKNNVYVHVKNDGISISNADCKKIFNKFIQSGTTGVKKFEGTGIGLSLSKSLIEMHSGNIWAVPNLKKGAEFIFSLPITTIPDCEVVNPSSSPSDSKIEKCIIEFSDIYSS